MRDDIFEVRFTLDERNFAFDMTFDPESPADADMAFWCRQAGTCEAEIVGLMNLVVRPGDFVVDCGANIGYFTVVLSQLVGMGGRVLAFEPDAYNVSKIEANLDLNYCRNVEVVRQLLWDTEKTKTLYTAQHRGHNSMALTEEATGAVQMQTTTLAAHVKEIPRLIKIDIEGAEEFALRGGNDEVWACPYITAELNIPSLERLSSSQNSLRGFMREHGYNTFLMVSTRAGKFFPLYIPPEIKISPSFLNLNLLFSPWDAIVEAWPELIL